MGLIVPEIWTFEVVHLGYLPLGVDRPGLEHVASGNCRDRNFQHWCRNLGVYMCSSVEMKKCSTRKIITPRGRKCRSVGENDCNYVEVLDCRRCSNGQVKECRNAQRVYGVQGG